MQLQLIPDNPQNDRDSSVSIVTELWAG